jgi:hypothetical protein
MRPKEVPKGSFHRRIFVSLILCSESCQIGGGGHIIIPFELLYKHVITKVLETEKELQSNIIHYLLVSANDVNLLEGSTKTITKATEVLEASEDIGPDEEEEKTTFTSPHQSTGRNHNRKTTNKHPERTATKLNIRRRKFKKS